MECSNVERNSIFESWYLFRPFPPKTRPINICPRFLRLFRFRPKYRRHPDRFVLCSPTKVHTSVPLEKRTKFLGLGQV